MRGIQILSNFHISLRVYTIVKRSGSHIRNQAARIRVNTHIGSSRCCHRNVAVFSHQGSSMSDNTQSHDQRQSTAKVGIESIPYKK